MRFRRCERWTVDEVVRPKVIKPVFVRFETADDGVPRLPEVRACMLTGRRVAAPDVPARRATAKVQPPAPRSRAFEAAGAARRDTGVNYFYVVFHRPRFFADNVCGRFNSSAGRANFAPVPGAMPEMANNPRLSPRMRSGAGPRTRCSAPLATHGHRQNQANRSRTPPAAPCPSRWR
jgi:hypothetical protein